MDFNILRNISMAAEVSWETNLSRIFPGCLRDSRFFDVTYCYFDLIL